MKKVYISVTNDLSSDQRVNRVANELSQMGYSVNLIGRKRSFSKPLSVPFKSHRMRLIFNKGPLFYAEYNLRLFFYLLLRKYDILLANDLDTLLPNFLASKLNGSKLVYDSHEYFTEVPELQKRKLVKSIWKRIEQYIFPKLKNVYTVNSVIAEIYNRLYNVDVKVVRNIPKNISLYKSLGKEGLGLPLDKRILILQGAGINVDRGAEELVKAMKFVDDALLLIIGSGDIVPFLKNLSIDLGLEKKIRFIDRLPIEELTAYTRNADIGLTLDKLSNLNYKYSLPNKLFDYIQAGIPILASKPIEVERIVRNYKIGELIDNHRPEHIAEKINFMLADNIRIQNWRQNIKKAQQELCWDKERVHLHNIFGNIE